ncbi:hypothetical protein [Brevibacillus nitrificans]|uniref:hypothetical protein n=1 Tax=Brevibacillus nitrificans TaxID=651560 RepID=UPI00285B4A02|nr:hypothetical protein [Brevibacillus nitrificans]MDR7316592.1 hypothetical protein [Brevibacillus nitrificans]
MRLELKENLYEGKGNPASTSICQVSGETGAYRAYKKGYAIMLAVAFLTGVPVRLSSTFTSSYAL